MGRINSHDKLSNKVIKKNKKSSRKTKDQQFPIVSLDEDSDFASIKLAPGIEAKSYLKDGIIFSENAKGQVIELQILNLSLTTSSRRKKPRKAGWDPLGLACIWSRRFAKKIP